MGYHTFTADNGNVFRFAIHCDHAYHDPYGDRLTYRLVHIKCTEDNVVSVCDGMTMGDAMENLRTLVSWVEGQEGGYAITGVTEDQEGFPVAIVFTTNPTELLMTRKYHI